MSLFPGQLTLKQLLLKFKLSHLYQRLEKQELNSLDILSECSEDDIATLCKTLNVSLLDKLKFKKALKSVNIPRQTMKYKIINKEEQNYIVEIHKSLKRMEDIVFAESNQNRRKLNENVINSSFDLLIGKINKQKQYLLKQCNDAYDNIDDIDDIDNENNKEIINYLNEAKDIKKQCQQLLIQNTGINDINSRTNTIKNLTHLCLSKEKNIIDIKSKLDQNMKDITVIVQSDHIDEFINNFVAIHVKNNNDPNVIYNNVIYQQLIEPLLDIKDENSDNIDTVLTDKIDECNDIKLFKHSPVRAWKWNKNTNKWMRRGKGTVTLYFNRKQSIAKIIFLDEQTNRTTLLQYIDANIKSLKCVKEGCVSWSGYDYSYNNKNPNKGVWIVKFIRDNNAASEFIEMINDQIEMISDKTDKINQNAETLQKTILIKKLYSFNNDNHDWKLRTSHTKIEFWRSNIDRKIKLIAKEGGDNGILIMNQYICITNPNLILKQELVYQWNAFDSDDTIISIWCAKFYCHKDADAFKGYFNECIDCVQLSPSKSVPLPNTKDISNTSSWSYRYINDVNNSFDFSEIVMDDNKQNDHQTTLEIICDEKQNEKNIGSNIGNNIGNDNDDLLKQIKIKYVNRWCIDNKNWETYASQTNLSFYKNNKNGRVRLQCKEIDNESGDNNMLWILRLNHWIPCKKIANLKQKDKDTFCWNAYDHIYGMSTFAITFYDEADAGDFQREFVKWSNHNESMN